ncbi:MAG: ferredoxin [Candidatus Magasanikbacteria bacterium]|nr:ferredoxin [Candidatus Magasanikbacteria bacterium]
MTPKVDKEKCIGCGACVAIAPNTFKMGDDGKSDILNPAGDSEESIKQAADGCPVQAISIE